MADPPVAEHFDDAAQQRESAGLGMWAFLTSEVLFFGGLFTGYVVYRYWYPHDFVEASKHLYMWVASANTAVLLASSLLMALAVQAAEHGRQRRCLRLLAGTAMLGLTFLIIKCLEYYLDYREEMWPAVAFDPSKVDAHPSRVELFLSFYFIMTGIHFVHVTVGVGVIGVVAWMLRRRGDPASMRNTIDNVGLYWHFVDVVWIFLFPLLYLPGAS